MNQLTVNDLRTHVPILGWLLIIGHAIFLVIGVFVFLLLAGIGAVSGDRQALAILFVVATFVAVLMAALSIPGIIAGYGLLKRRNWGRVLGIIVAILNLLNFPIGTLLGGYALFVLMQTSASEYFS